MYCIYEYILDSQEHFFYQIYPQSFYDSNNNGIGDINGITLKLDYLKNLDVDIIWLSPVYDSPNYDNGYDIRDYFKIMTEFGTMDDFGRMLSEMKRCELKLVMDLVANHSSDEHPWFIDSKKSKDNPYPDFYHWAPGKDGKAPNEWEAGLGMNDTYDILTDEYYLHTFTSKQPDLKWENRIVRQEVYKIIRWWLDKVLGVDGLRMNVINFISKAPRYPEGEIYGNAEYSHGSPCFVNGPHVHDYLQEMNEQVLRHYNIVTIGECPGANIIDAHLFSCTQRKELDMIFTFEHMSLDGGRRDMEVIPRIGVNPNFIEVNVEDALKDPRSIYYYYYQKLIELRRTMPIIVYGKYDILHQEHEHIFIYRRYNENLNNKIIVACNFSQQPMKIDNAQLSERLTKCGHLLISNYEKMGNSNYLDFRSYETWTIEMKQS
ncbi:unnamed protein product [Adineta ricciae]|uniref:Glycosyl hydrolase family 13 catalytic domain-containing protein n=1 Tax=Adineta ricciae TaxID=249248 RepID=A0A815I948_ADIRI|nr:unnamed protein product [Adineta ricciae]CAF1476579.1 unnamed protein product [Adineta ricciae]